jgi:hypothetical protein
MDLFFQWWVNSYIDINVLKCYKITWDSRSKHNLRSRIQVYQSHFKISLLISSSQKNCSVVAVVVNVVKNCLERSWAFLRDIRPCRPLKVSRWFGETSSPLSETKRQETSMMHHVPLKRWLTFNGLHGLISQNMELFSCFALLTELIMRGY